MLRNDGCELLFGHDAADHLSRMAIGCQSASLKRLLRFFLAWNPGLPVVSKTTGGKVDKWIALKLDLLRSLGHVSRSGTG